MVELNPVRDELVVYGGTVAWEYSTIGLCWVLRLADLTWWQPDACSFASGPFLRFKPAAIAVPRWNATLLVGGASASWQPGSGSTVMRVRIRAGGGGGLGVWVSCP